MADLELDVIAVAPHPDDLEISCGGTIAKLVQLGYKVGMVDMTDGEPTPLSAGPAERLAEAKKAAEILGATVRETLDLPNRLLMDGPEARYTLATVFRRYKPKLVIAMGGRTPMASPDHWQGTLLAEAAVFYSRLTKWDERFGKTAPHTIKNIIYAPVFGELNPDWQSSMVVDITDTIDRKIEAVKAYTSQFKNRPQIADVIRSGAMRWGARCGFQYGELLVSHRPLAVTDPMKVAL
jgi:bacillithiol biosynthesis deacetylase BshB1